MGTCLRKYSLCIDEIYYLSYHCVVLYALWMVVYVNKGICGIDNTTRKVNMERLEQEMI